MMNKRKEPQKIAASKGSSMNVSIRKQLYYITLLLCITTTIAGWNIHDLWSGIIAALCGVITIWLVWITTGGIKDDRI